MDWTSIKNKTVELFKKYKYAFIVLLIGILLIMLPSEKAKEAETRDITMETENILPIEEQMSQILSLVKGAGKVQVMITVASGEETLYQSDESKSTSNNTTSTRIETVTVTDGDRNQQGLVRQINPPIYLGAIVVCQGADNPVVRLAIVEAIADITGLGSDKISVLKMK